MMVRGGKREGAGRKTIGSAAKVKINITIDAELLKYIDAHTSNRSQWIESVVRQAIAANVG